MKGRGVGGSRGGAKIKKEEGASVGGGWRRGRTGTGEGDGGWGMRDRKGGDSNIR